MSDHEVEVWHSAEEDIDVVSLDAAARQTGTGSQERRGSVVVSTSAWHAAGRGSIPARTRHVVVGV